MESNKSDDEQNAEIEASKDGSRGGKIAVCLGLGDESESRRLIELAQDEARRLGHGHIGTEQILVALTRCTSGVAPGVLSDLGLTKQIAREAVESVIGRGGGFVGAEIPFTPRAQRVLELSWKVARELGHSYIAPEHLLLAIMAEGDGIAARVLEKVGIDKGLICVRVREELLDSA